jgi:hypothetical protein
VTWLVPRNITVVTIVPRDSGVNFQGLAVTNVALGSAGQYVADDPSIICQWIGASNGTNYPTIKVNFFVAAGQTIWFRSTTVASGCGILVNDA